MLGFLDPHDTRASLPCLTDHTDLSHQLAHVPLFKGVQPEPLRRIIALARLTHRRSGGFFFNEGDAASEFFVLTSGRVKLTQVTPAGHQVVFGLIGPGDAFGGVGAFGDPNYPVSAETVETSAAVTWAAVTMQNVFETHTDVALNALRFVADRLCDLQHRYREVMTERVERRVMTSRYRCW